MKDKVRRGGGRNQAKAGKNQSVGYVLRVRSSLFGTFFRFVRVRGESPVAGECVEGERFQHCTAALNMAGATFLLLPTS